MSLLPVTLYLTVGFLCPMLLLKLDFKKKPKRDKTIPNREDVLLIHAYISLISLYLAELKEKKWINKFLSEYFEYNPVLFEKCTLISDGTLDSAAVISNCERLSETDRLDEVNTVFSDLLSQLHENHKEPILLKLSEQAFVKSYDAIRNMYGDSPLTFDILRNLPKGVLEEERIALLPRDELEVRVRERTKKLTEVNIALQNEIKERKKVEKALERKAEELARLNAELEQFFYIASHHLQEPIRSVISYSQLFKQKYESYLGDEADMYLTYMSDGALRIRDLVNDVRTFSQINTHGKPLTQVNCSELMDTVIALVRNIYKENTPLVTYESLPTILADKKQLTQVFTHLIDNAIKYCDTSFPEIHVSAKIHGKDYLFMVRDNGIGIEPQYFEKIFMIFQRLHNNQKYKGTGVGLALCKKIIERHGGRIWVESEGEQKGSTFCFTIPQKGISDD
ncbi:GHKL domain-containing protein [bacterium]|nr:MAG: GHKL domain-containing protein [bacterium]